MGDIVNDYFKRFYPAGWQDETNFDYTTMLGGMWRYKDYAVERIFPRIVCADGFSMSVQGHAGAYCRPRSDFAAMYTEVEIGFPSERVEEIMPYIDGADNDPTETVYGYVPVSLVEQIITKHGGLKP